MNAFRHDTSENRISALLLLLFAGSLPFDRFYSQLLLFTLVVHTLIHLRRDRWKKIPVMALSAQSCIWLLTVLGTAGSGFAEQAFPFWERQSALLLLPLCIYLLNVDLARYRSLLLTVFILVVTLVTAYLFGDALRTIFYFHQPIHYLWSPAYLSHNFAAPLDLHATYLSLFLAIAFTTSLQRILGGGRPILPLTIYVVAAIILAAGLLQLASRAVLIGQLLIALTLLPMALQRRAARIAWIAALAASCVASIFVVKKVAPPLYERLVTELSADLDTERATGLLADPRGERWLLAQQVWRQAPLLGHGSGSEVPLLRATYFNHGLYNSYLHSLNAHNQYLSILIRHGAPGLFIWTASLLFFAHRAFRRRDLLLAAFLLLVVCTALSENLLDVNKGIFFYAFFLALLSAAPKNSGQLPPQSNPARVRLVRIKQARKLPRP